MNKEFYKKSLTEVSEQAYKAGYAKAIADILGMLNDNYKNLSEISAYKAISKIADLTDKLLKTELKDENLPAV